MKSFFYPRLAFTNLKKNAKLYFPYLLTSSFTVMMFYLINYLSSHDGIDQMSTGSRTMQVILNLGKIVIIIFSVIFLFYMNSFLMKRRKKEIALYNILGLEKKRYSDLPDEVQIKNKVSLKNLTCLTLPIHLMQNNEKGIIYTENQVLDHLETVNKILNENSIDVPIYDLFSRTKLDSEEKVRKVMSKYKI